MTVTPLRSVAPTATATPATPVRLRAPLVGRDAELARLESTLGDTLNLRAPRTLVVMGGAGIGKSRLIREFLADARIKHPELHVLSGQCREGGERYGVMRGLLRNRLGLVDGMDPETAGRTLRGTVSEVMGDRRVGELVHFLGSFLDLESPGSQLAQAMSDDPDQLRQVGRSVLRRFLEADAMRQPLLLALDDFHLAHADAASLVHYLVRSVSAAPILFVIVARPELFDRHAEWLELSGGAARLDLQPLDGDDTARMTEHLLAPTGDIPPELVDEATELAAGNPFLVEQIVRAFIDQGVIDTSQPKRWTVHLERLDEVQLPLSVDDAIAARIAGLSGEQRRVLELAATMGGVFWLGALVALQRTAGTPPRLWADPKRDREHLAALLEELVERDYVMRLPDASIAGENEYAFKHNLEREALQRYTSRQLLAQHHRVIAQWLEVHLGESSEEQHELLAQHYDLGGAALRAGHHYLSAAERARGRFAYARAAEYYRRALSLLGDAEGLTRLSALEHFGDALAHSGQRDHALAVFEQMRCLAYQVDFVAQAAVAHARIGQLHRDLAHLDQALEHLETAQALRESTGDRKGSSLAMAQLASIHLLKGNFDAADHMFRDAIGTFEQGGDERALVRALIGQACLQRERLQLEPAQDTLVRALALARKLDDDAGSADALIQLGAVRDRLGQTDRALALWHEALSIAQRVSDRVRQASALVCLGASAYRDGAHAEAVAHLAQAASLASALDDHLLEADVLRSLAKARAFTGDAQGGLADAQRATEILEGAKSKPELAVALRTCAEILGSLGASADAIELLERACGLFEELGSDMELARASLLLAEQLGQGSAERAEGRDRAVRAESLRTRARLLLERHAGLTMRAGAMPKRA